MTLFFLILYLFFNLIIFKKINFLASKLNLIDFSSSKLHQFDTPKFGFFLFLNLIFFLILFNFYFNLPAFNHIYTTYILSFLILGYLDDRYNLSVKLRFFLSLISILFFFYIINNKFFISINFSNNLNLILLIFFSLGFIHLINMTDGINGLVPSIFIYSCIYFYFKAFYVLDLYFQLIIILSILGISVFLIPNFLGICFLGNAGSYLVSIIISLLSMKIFTYELIEYSDIILIFIIPLLDGIRVTIKRLINKQNPFKGDYLHIHHIIRSNKRLLIMYFMLIFSPSCINFFIEDYSYYIGIFSILFFSIFYFLVIKKTYDIN